MRTRDRRKRLPTTEKTLRQGTNHNDPHPDLPSETRDRRKRLPTAEETLRRGTNHDDPHLNPQSDTRKRREGLPAAEETLRQGTNHDGPHPDLRPQTRDLTSGARLRRLPLPLFDPGVPFDRTRRRLERLLARSQVNGLGRLLRSRGHQDRRRRIPTADGSAGQGEVFARGEGLARTSVRQELLELRPREKPSTSTAARASGGRGG